MIHTGYRVPHGFTLVEVLTAAALAVLLLLVLTQTFADVSGTINEYRSTIEMRGRMRQIVQKLQQDLSGATATPMQPPLNPKENPGYFVIKEGPVGPIYRPEVVGSLDLETSLRGQAISLRRRQTSDPTIAQLQVDRPLEIDPRLGDADDVIVFTTQVTQSSSPSFRDVFGEVAWFVRGTTLYRQVRRIIPNYSGQGYETDSGLPPRSNLSSTYASNSFRPTRGPYDNHWRREEDQRWMHLVPNTLGDLTIPENRLGHLPRTLPVGSGAPPRYFQHDIRFWGELQLPTLGEQRAFDWSDPTREFSWPYPTAEYHGTRFNMMQSPYNVVVPKGLTLNSRGWVELTPRLGSSGNPLPFDPEFLPLPYQELTATYEELQSDPSRRLFSGFITDPDPNDGYNPNDQVIYKTTFFEQDSVFQNVLAFDVKVWDPHAPIFPSPNTTGDPNSQARRPITPDHPDYLIRIQAGAQPIALGSYVDLNYMCLLGPNHTPGPTDQPRYNRLPLPHFHGPGHAKSFLYGQAPHTSPLNAWASVYDTWTTHYENDGIDQDYDGAIDEGTNGIDDPTLDLDGDGDLDPVGGIDDRSEREAPPPYPHPLRGIQITLRVFDPDSQEVREMVVTQDFIFK